MKPHHAHKHGHASSSDRGPSSEYATWAAMLQRCSNPNHAEYKNYGGRGIMVCARWASFEKFLKDMGPRPAGYSLDREDNNNGYNPTNCRWTTRSRQARNTRVTHMIEIDGVMKALSDWCEIYRINPSTVAKRIHRSGWSPEQAVTTPPLWRR